jgi:cysteine synthase A
MIAPDITATTGRTPIVELSRLARGLPGRVIAKPDTMSSERVALLQQFGARVELTPGMLMIDAVQRAEKLAQSMADALRLDQSRSVANPEVHRRTSFDSDDVAEARLVSSPW